MMGAWGVQSFQNDTAGDWTDQFSRGEDLKLVQLAISRVLSKEDEYLESDDACSAIAACEVLAALNGQPCEKTPYSEHILQWISNHEMEVRESLLIAGQKALDRITSYDSELNELWEESEHYDDWLSAVDDLRVRITP
ncbi:MAG: DUF4259 domain-containing protein [Planctomycetaceae bacterium]|nr:DUF4259 domain-containing protein [Planctomycetaceae bacterium]